MSITISAEIDSLAQKAKAEEAKNNSSGNSEEASPFPARNFIYGMFAMYALPLLVGILFGAVGIWSLVTRKAGEWFAFAIQIRAEHRHMKEQFQ